MFHVPKSVPNFAQSITPASREIKLYIVFREKNNRSKITCWTSALNFTTTQSETVNQLPRTNARCENTFTVSHIWFCKFAACTDRCQAPGLPLATTTLVRNNRHHPNILAIFVNSQLCELFLQFSYTRSGQRQFTVNFLLLAQALVSPRKFGKIGRRRLPYTYVFKPFQNSGDQNCL